MILWELEKIGKRIWHLTCYLMKENAFSFRDCIRDDAIYGNYKLRNDIQYEGIIVIGKVKVKEPRWIKFLQEVSMSTFGKIKNQSTRAILFLKTESRIFAFTFGYGSCTRWSSRLGRYRWFLL